MTTHKEERRVEEDQEPELESSLQPPRCSSRPHEWCRRQNARPHQEGNGVGLATWTSTLRHSPKVEGLSSKKEGSRPPLLHPRWRRRPNLCQTSEKTVQKSVLDRGCTKSQCPHTIGCMQGVYKTERWGTWRTKKRLSLWSVLRPQKRKKILQCETLIYYAKWIKKIIARDGIENQPLIQVEDEAWRMAAQRRNWIKEQPLSTRCVIEKATETNHQRRKRSM